MFVQIIQGRCTDPAGLRKQWDLWDQELKPNATGFLGSTGGVAEDGTFFEAARFESAEVAKQNSDRPEQGQWWSETEQYLEDVTFTDSSDITEWAKGGSDDAGFVQVMQYRPKDEKRLAELDEEFDDQLTKLRPDIIGGYAVKHPDGKTTSVNYFTSEAEARKGESQEFPEELTKTFQEWQSLLEDLKYIDLKEPWLNSK